MTFPTGLAMLDTRPDAMGSLPVKKTIGIVFVAAFAANHFWTMAGQTRFAATNEFFEHFGLISGFVIAALLADHDERKKRSDARRA